MLHEAWAEANACGEEERTDGGCGHGGLGSCCESDREQGASLRCASRGEERCMARLRRGLHREGRCQLLRRRPMAAAPCSSYWDTSFHEKQQQH